MFMNKDKEIHYFDEQIEKFLQAKPINLKNMSIREYLNLADQENEADEIEDIVC